MAKPRVFVSSTYYDLKHVRSSLDQFIESLGFEPMLSEKGNIAFTPNSPLDESCCREAASADIFVLIIGGRYGTEAGEKQKTPDRTFFERYESITKKEFESAIERDIPVYVLVETNVYSEYQTYLRNKGNTGITYAHVDSVNVFCLIEDILSKPRNNPMHIFERFSDIETWLREQWAGFFRELLQKQSHQQQLSALSAQVLELKATNETLRKYLEAVMKGITPDASKTLIESEKRRLQELVRNERIKTNRWYQYATKLTGLSFNDFLDVMEKTNSFKDFAKRLGTLEKSQGQPVERDIFNILLSNEVARRDFNAMRRLLGLTLIRLSKGESQDSAEDTGKSQLSDAGDKK